MPHGKPTITADVYWRSDPDKNEIALEIEIAGHKFRELVLKLEDQALREALVALGWTPPAQDAERLTLVTEC